MPIMEAEKFCVESQRDSKMQLAGTKPPARQSISSELL